MGGPGMDGSRPGRFCLARHAPGYHRHFAAPRIELSGLRQNGIDRVKDKCPLGPPRHVCDVASSLDSRACAAVLVLNVRWGVTLRRHDDFRPFLIAGRRGMMPPCGFSRRDSNSFLSRSPWRKL